MVTQVTPTNEARLQERLQLIKTDFRYCLREIWRNSKDARGRRLPDPHWVQYDMADWLQHGPKRRGLRGKRGISKTWITCAYIAWRLLRNPSLKVLLVSATPGNSKKSLHMLRGWFDTIWFLKHLAPKAAKKWRDDAEIHDVGACQPTRDPSITAMGILGPLPAPRPNLIVPDDIETPENTLTKDARNLLAKRTEEFEHILLEDGDSVYLGTDHHEESVYEKLEKRGYTFRAWPIAYPTKDETVPGLAPRLAHNLKTGKAKPGDPTWKERFPTTYIEELKIASVQTFAMQEMLRRGLADSELYPLKLQNFMVYPLHRDKAPNSMAWGKRNSLGSTVLEDIPSPGFDGDMFYGPIFIDDKWTECAGTKAYLDPSGLKERDDMAWAIVGQLHGILFGKYINGVSGGALQENLEMIVHSLREYGATELYIEENFGPFLIAMLPPIITRYSIKPNSNALYPNGWSCQVTPVRSHGAKEHRIITTMEPLMNSHRIVLDPRVAEDTKFSYQVSRIQNKRNCLEHDDQIEAFAGACKEWIDYLGQDVDTMAVLREEEAIEQMMRDELAELGPPEVNWLKHRQN